MKEIFKTERRFRSCFPENKKITISELAPQKVEGGVWFSFPDREGVTSVAIAGIFNYWDKDVDHLVKGNDGVWRLTRKLSPGRHLYKFVINDTEWILDPANPVLSEDGQHNSAITVNEDGDVLLRTVDIDKDNPGYFYRNSIAVESAVWLKNAVVYELHIEAYTDAGFKGLIDKLPYLKELGVNALWIMPIHEIGLKNRNGSLGDPYAVKDFYSIRSGLGTMSDFKMLVETAQGQGIKVIMDWTLNRSSCDNPLVWGYPEWYTQDENGQVIYKIPGRDCFAGFDFTNLELRRYIINGLKFWLKGFDLDGYRFDDSDMVPTDFLVEIRKELKEIKRDIVLISQSYDEIHNATSCDLTYEGGIREVICEIALGNKTQYDFLKAYNSMKYSFPKNSLRLHWLEEKEQERAVNFFGERFVYPATTILLTMESVPFIMMGQEFGDKNWQGWHSLFEPFKLDWNNFDTDLFQHFKKLISIRMSHAAFTCGELELIENDNAKVISYLRILDADVFLVMVNLSAEGQSCLLSPADFDRINLGQRLKLDDLLSCKDAVYQADTLKNKEFTLSGFASSIYKINNLEV